MATWDTLAANDRFARPRINLSEPRRAHLVGIGGTGMKALAELLTDANWRLSGSDPQTLPESLRSRGVRLSARQDGSALSADTELLIHSPAVRPDNPERRIANTRHIPVFSYTEILAELSRDHATLSVSGTHGKSTTSAWVAHLLEHAGLSPSVIVGAESCSRSRSGWRGSGSHLVLESCEYQRNFLQLTPAHLAITNIEPDHFESYPQLDDALEAYTAFAALVAPSGRLVIPANNPLVSQVARQTHGSIRTFGIDCDADWQATDCRFDPTGPSFVLRHRGEIVGPVRLRLHGRHNLANALAAVALADAVGIQHDDLLAGLASFPGIRRRFEVIRDGETCTLIDDYAHHPTAIRETLRAARERYPQRRIVCLFQPHQLKRTERLFDEFVDALTAADLSLIPPVFAARELSDDAARDWSRKLADAIHVQGSDAESVESLDRVVSTVEDKTRAGDVILTMGAGDLNRINHELIGRLFRDS